MEKQQKFWAGVLALNMVNLIGFVVLRDLKNEIKVNKLEPKLESFIDKEKEFWGNL